MHRIKEKGFHATFIATIYTGACLAPRKRLASTTLHDVVSQAAAMVYFSCRTPPVKAGLHATFI
jgi:hypothetical protein